MGSNPIEPVKFIKMQNIQEWVDEISNQNSLIIVEGKKDKQALNKLGINNTYSLDKSMHELIDFIIDQDKEVIILTDLDGEGKKLYSKIKNELQRNGIKVNDKYRKFLSRCNLTHIEGLYTYYKNNSREPLD